MEKKKKDAAKKKEEAGETAEAEEAAPMEINMEDLDVFGVTDVGDVGNGEPLMAHFVYEDWALLNARYQFHLLLHAFRKDLNDPDRPSFGEKHMLFYYHKYYKKNFQLNGFNVTKFGDFVELIKDTIGFD